MWFGEILICDKFQLVIWWCYIFNGFLPQRRGDAGDYREGGKDFLLKDFKV